MCCGAKSHHASWGHHHAGFCGCGGPLGLGMCFSTREEKITWLEEYLESLREQVAAIEERLAKLKAEA